MGDAQRGLYAAPTRFGRFLEFDCGEAPAALDALAGVRDDCAAIGFGASCWDRLQPAWRPAGLGHFDGVRGTRHTAPATQRDLFVTLADDDFGDLFDRARRVAVALQAAGATLADETLGFDYHHSHDLIGFEDGTANPKGHARKVVAEIPEDQIGAGGSFAFTQKWIHDLAAFNALPIADQEAVIGRTKVDSIELKGDAMPPSSHVSRTDLKVGEVAQKIWRRSMPYGDTQQHGLYFLCFTCELSRVRVQLESMYDVAGSGTHDRLLDFSEAVSGSYWFVPAQCDLDGIR